MAGGGPGWRFIPWPAYLRLVKYETNHWLRPDEISGGFNVNGFFAVMNHGPQIQHQVTQFVKIVKGSLVEKRPMCEILMIEQSGAK